ncbi:PstS family phosphate ABC transporter substrate-binding protein [Halorientalis salina]|uniref:PstS family phosphate ABC transporter substrate-binding protein n=1 Tax=Halorientalis salina TaxID=2932266 RepID=UPI0010AC06D4|nr:PstS family phosphate ABC transporter substrate-binding protein [Halorientalis salina]
MTRELTSVSRREFVAGVGATSALALAGCTQDTSGDGGLSGEVVVKGSSTVFPVSDKMAEEFMSEHGDVNVTTDSTGSGGGFENHFCPGNADINGASRPITDSEIEHCGENDVEPIEFQVASDALTVAVNNASDVDCVTFDELSQIWREDRTTTWSDVNEEWPNQEFSLYGPANTSGTYDWFNENVVGEEYSHTADHQATEDDNQIVRGIEDNENAMGYFGYAYYQENSDRVKALEIEQSEGDGCTEPSLSNAKDGSYPMARPLFIYVNKESLQREEVYEFVKFYLENAETNLVQDIGYVPSGTDLRDENLSKLEENYDA